MPRAAARSRRFAWAASPPRSLGDPVVVERVGGGDRVLVAAPALDPLRGSRPLPQADQPQPGDPAPGERVELLVGDRVERPDLAAVASRQLVEPDVGALGEQDEARHPFAIVEKRSGSSVRAGERRASPATGHRRRRRTAGGAPAPPRPAGPRPRAAARPGRRAGSTPTARARSAAGRPRRSASGAPARAGASTPATRRRHLASSSPKQPVDRLASRRRRHCAAATGPGSTSGRSGAAAGLSAATSSRSSDSSRSGRPGSGPNSVAEPGQDVVDRLPADGLVELAQGVREDVRADVRS